MGGSVDTGSLFAYTVIVHNAHEENTMTLNQLIQHLQDLATEHGDREVRLAHQPSYPLELTLAQVVAVNVHAEDIDHALEAIHSGGLEPEEVKEAQEQVDAWEHPDNTIVYLAEGRQVGYLPGAVAQQLRWGR